ncbi:MAG: hypothetical protein Q8K48_06610 [Candidatus Planktophila sp.]|nr:hypothetical protein [Candidatus Planktophila sp.]
MPIESAETKTSVSHSPRALAIAEEQTTQDEGDWQRINPEIIAVPSPLADK